MDVPAAARAAVLEVLGRGEDAELRLEPVGGGCISPAARASSGRDSVFVKWRGGNAPHVLFLREAESLRAIDAVKAVRVPEVLRATEDALILEWLEPGEAGSSDWQAFGAAIAMLHRNSAPSFGWEHDNFIGPLTQPNGWCGRWPQFFAEQRITPQLTRAFSAGYFSRSERLQLEQFRDSVQDALPDVPPSLLHGDLWSGNAHALESGELAVIDPASYYGDREADLAMTELFGGFPPAFYAGYESEWPTLHAERVRRRAAYRVYYLLVHVNLFGRSYVARTLEAARLAR